MQEKPEQPRSDLASTAMYLFSESTLRLLERYLAEGNAPDPPGSYLAWLAEREPVYGFSFDDPWHRHRRSRAAPRGRQPLPGAAGLPQRDVYSL